MAMIGDGNKKSAKDADGGKYMKVDDGGKVVIAIRADATLKESWYDEKEKKSHPWKEEFKKEGKKKSTRFVFQVYNFTVARPQIFEVGVGLFNDIVKADDKYGLEKAAFEVSRTGKGRDTEWGFLFDHNFTDDENKLIAQAPLVKDGDDEESSGGASDLGSYEKEEKKAEATGPLDADTQATIKGRLKPAGKEKAAEFLKELGAGKVSDIPASKKKQALELLEKYAPSAPAAEEDPFA